MINSVKNTSEYVYSNIKLDKTRKIKENTPHDYEQKYGSNYHRFVKVKCVVDFLDKITNEKKCDY